MCTVLVRAGVYACMWPCVTEKTIFHLARTRAYNAQNAHTHSLHWVANNVCCTCMCDYVCVCKCACVPSCFGFFTAVACAPAVQRVTNHSAAVWCFFITFFHPD
eukprot:GDKI01005272.1.p2 GENE.GDKI01005272.1~~GDKI01005272.1.p2  ORF type:complete len:104 (-),score=29.61 GDKI01005272.1:33-344(-)